MGNFVLFLNAFMSYLLVFFVSVIVIGLAVFIGITTRKMKDQKVAALVATETQKLAQDK